jgi:hypothetical protein
MDALIVPRGLSSDYYYFLEVSARANRCELIVDRRGLGERRRHAQPVASDDRVAERRGPLPDTWQELGFIRATRP